METRETGSRPPWLLDVPRTCAGLGIGRSTFYELVGRGEIAVVHVGRRTLVPVTSIDAYVQRLQASEPVPAA